MVLLALRPVARTSRSLNVFTILILVGLVLITAEFYQGNAPLNYLIVANSSLVLWLLYVYWYSILPTLRSAIKVGNFLPELTFVGKENEEVSSTDFEGKKVLFMFYRGNWCPLCMAQIREISTQYQELERRGVAVLLISPQPVSHSVALAKKMKVNFHFLTDVNNAMARQLKIDQDHGVPLGFEVLGYKSETVLPTVIITDEQGKILFLDQTDNYRVRPEPETFLEVLDD
jgi:peroxiredoxin